MSIKLKKLLNITKPSEKITEIKILSEGFFSSLAKLFKGKDTLKKSKKLRGALSGLNNSLTDLEKALQKETGKKVKLQKIKFSDLYK
tara:strand:+ start:206 stop:466 length:261 start_codon:yes stop_codon:yes gene_type:complete